MTFLELDYVEIFRNFPPNLATMFISILPISELRGAIPIAIGVYHMSPLNAFFWAVLGNSIPPILIIFFLDKVANFLSKHFVFWKKFFDWLFERTRRKAKDKIEKYGSWGLFFLVAIPLPMTGGWTGALAAFIFGIDKKKSIPVIILGIITAGIIVTLLTLGIKQI